MDLEFDVAETLSAVVVTSGDRLDRANGAALEITERHASMDAFNEGHHNPWIWLGNPHGEGGADARTDPVHRLQQGAASRYLEQVMLTCDCGGELRCFGTCATGPRCMRPALQARLVQAAGRAISGPEDVDA